MVVVSSSVQMDDLVKVEIVQSYLEQLESEFARQLTKLSQIKQASKFALIHCKWVFTNSSLALTQRLAVATYMVWKHLSKHDSSKELPGANYMRILHMKERRELAVLSESRLYRE